jgi:hypothetical protein
VCACSAETHKAPQELTLSTANAIIGDACCVCVRAPQSPHTAPLAGCFAKAADGKFKPLTVVVLDAGGHVKAVQKQDGSSMLRFEA